MWDLAEGETAPWLTIDGEKAQVTVHGRAYHTTNQPIKGNDVPADAQLIGETTLDFAAPGTKTATINKPSNLDGGYVTWVWSVEKNNQPEEWSKYLINTTVSDGWAAENEVIELPKLPTPAPSVSAPTIEPSEAPTPSATEPTPTPSVTPSTPAPTPSESQTSSPTPAPSTTTPATPYQEPSPSVTPSTPVSETPGAKETPAPTPTDPAGSTTTPVEEPSSSLAHTGSTTLPLFGLSATALAGGLTLVFRKRNVG